MRRLLIPPLVWLLVYAPFADATTYYVSKSLGSDSHTTTQAQSKSTPWAHVPGMAGATGAASSYTPVAGDEFILYGGDTWGTADLPMEIDQNGSGQCLTTPNSSCIYVGVDTTWYSSGVCGASFCRPIFSQQSTYESGWYAIAYLYGQYVTLDNVEITGMLTSGGNTARMVSMGGGGGGNVLEHSYLHGWTHSTTGCPSACTDADNSVVITAPYANTVVHDNWIDGGDTLAATAVTGNPCAASNSICQGMNAGISGAALSYNNYVANVSSGIVTAADNFHDNWIGPVWLGYTGGHRNGVQIAGTVSAAYLLAYNNVLTQVQDGGMGGFWLEQGTGNSGVTAYVFNNLLFPGSGSAAGLGEGMQFCQEGTACGPFYAFNNTIEAQFNLSSCCSSSTTAHLYNNHCIGETSCVNNEGTWTVSETTDLPQCSGTGAGCANANSSPHFDQYNDSQTYADSPVGSTNSTVHAGTNESSIATTISGLNAAAGTAALSGTGYTCALNATNHTVSCPDLSLNARGSNWDIGAYQFSALLFDSASGFIGRGFILQ